MSIRESSVSMGTRPSLAISGLALIALFLLAPALLAQDSSVSGRVISDSGSPIPDVSVSGMSHNSVGGYSEPRTSTDANGGYQLDSVGRVLFFRKQGYRPLTELRSTGTQTVNATLQTENSVWEVPTCAPLQQKGVKPYGMSLLFGIPKDVRVEEGKPDVDNWKVFAFFPRDRKQKMTIWSGPLLGGGSRFTAWESWYLDGSVITERAGSGMIDIRGKMPNGRRWRSVSWITDIASYHDVSEEAAKFFDGIIDSACLKNQ